MASGRDARDWAAAGGLHGIGDSLYTPFSGPDGDDIDWDAYRALVRYCVGDYFTPEREERRWERPCGTSGS